MKGFLFALLSTFFSAIVYIAAHEAMIGTHFSVFLFYWNFLACVFFMIYSFCYEKIPMKIAPKSRVNVLIYTFLEVFSSILFFSSLKYLSPSISSFVSLSYLIFVVILGIVILKEVFSKLEILGASLILIGVAIISFKNGNSSASSTKLGVFLMLASSFVWAISNIVTKKLIVANENALLLAFIRSFAFMLYGLFSLIFYKISDPAIVMYPLILPALYIALGAFSGPFLSLIFRYTAMKYLDVSKISLITSQYPIIVLILGFIFFGQIPEIIKIIGGILALIGTTFFSLSKLYSKHFYKLKKL